MSALRYETRGVLAGAYKARSYERATLTHALAIDDSKTPWEAEAATTLCGRIKSERLADPHAMDTAETPTCATCAARLARRIGR